MPSRNALRDFSVFCLLAAIGVVGRWVQPEWHFTPLMAVTVLGGYYFRSLGAAIMLPIVVRAISDWGLGAYENSYVQASVYLMMIVPLLLGRLARGQEGWKLGGCGVLCGLVPATTFFVATNFVHWASTSMYDHTWQGLMNCYTAALPFYRSMIAGDLFYLALLVGCLAIAMGKDPELARERVKK